MRTDLRGRSFGQSFAFWWLLTALSSANAAAAELIQSDRLRLELGGFVAAQATVDTNPLVSGNHLTRVEAADWVGRSGWAFDASRLNLVATSPGQGWTATGRLEVDLYGGLRLRHVYAAAERDGFRLLLGQTDTLIGNRVGPNLFNNDWFWSQGNAYDRMPQLRVGYHGERWEALVALVPSVLRTASPLPHLQLRVGYTTPEGLYAGLAGHAGVTADLSIDGPGNTSTEVLGSVASYLLAADLRIPVGPATISLQGWYGAAGAHGTGAQDLGGPLFTLNGEGGGVSVPAAGGFADAVVKVGPRLSLGAAAGANAVLDPAVSVKSNLTAGAYLRYQLTDPLALAVESQWARTARDEGIATNLRALVGAQFSF